MFVYIAIFLGSTKIPHDEFVRRILEVDEEKLNDELITSLIKNLPEGDTIQNVYKRKDEFDDMQEAEQFCVKVGSDNSSDWCNSASYLENT